MAKRKREITLRIINWEKPEVQERIRYLANELVFLAVKAEWERRQERRLEVKEEGRR